MHDLSIICTMLVYTKMTKYKANIIYCIVGPTASGKTALSIKLAKKLGNAEIISADSRQVYKDLNLSTGKVTKEEMEGIPHHLIDICTPGDYFSVVKFTEMALEIIEDILKRGNTPIICGGTGFYIDSILYKYDLPDVKPNGKLRKLLKDKPVEEVYEYFLKLNYPEAIKIQGTEHSKNKHRLIRRIEVVNELGTFPELKKELRFNKNEYEIEILKTNVPRKELREKIYLRLIDRIKQGMIEEIKSVKEKYNLSDNYLNGLGLEFKWVNKYLNQEISKEEMIERLFIEICQYAKRQEAWFKRY